MPICRFLTTSIHNLMFHSSMTLFASAGPDEAVFAKAVHQYFDGQWDSRTQGLLRVG